MRTIRQLQKAVSAAERAGKSAVWCTTERGESGALAMALHGTIRPSRHGAEAGLMVVRDRALLQQHQQHALVRQVLRLDGERDLGKALAFLARRYGANTRCDHALSQLAAELVGLCGYEEASGEERKKDTDEVDGSTQTGDETHGGDRSSGEVPDSQSQSGGDRSSGEVPDSQSQSGEPQADTRAEAQKALRKTRRAQQRHGNGRGRGGFAAFGTLDRSLVRRARAALAALARAGASAVSARYDHTELVKRLVSHRPLLPARREETGRPVILVIADVSGSCASFAAPACDVAQACGALGVPGADVVTVRCYNVWEVQEVRVNHRPMAFDAAQIATPGAFADWIARTVGGQIEVVIGLGDSDEYTTYESFANLPSVERMIWLDNYGSKRLENTPTRRQRIAANWRGEGGGAFAPAANRKLTYMVGCGNAEAMVVGVEKALLS